MINIEKIDKKYSNKLEGVYQSRIPLEEKKDQAILILEELLYLLDLDDTAGFLSCFL